MLHRVRVFWNLCAGLGGGGGDGGGLSELGASVVLLAPTVDILLAGLGVNRRTPDFLFCPDDFVLLHIIITPTLILTKEWNSCFYF